jgi:hypothetical protein
MKASASEPLWKCREDERDVKTGGVAVSRDKRSGNPMSRLRGIRHVDGASISWALMRKARTCRCDDKGEVQVVATMSMRVPMRSTGAEQLVGSVESA